MQISPLLPTETSNPQESLQKLKHHEFYQQHPRTGDRLCDHSRWCPTQSDSECNSCSAQAASTRPENRHHRSDRRRTNQRENVGQIFLNIIRESSTVIHDQLTAKVAEGFQLNHLHRLVIPVTSARALEAIISFLNFNIITAMGALGEMKGTTSEDNPLYRHMRIREVVTAIGFKHIVDQMDRRINGTFYRGGSHRYRLPVEDVRLSSNAKVVTPYNRSVRQQIVASVVQAHLDGHLANKTEFEKLGRDIPAFGSALAVERARRQAVAAANAGHT